MNASYVSATQFTVAGDQTALFTTGRRVRGDCGVDGYKYGTISTSSYSDPNTTVTLEEEVLTSNLTVVHYGIVDPSAVGSLPDHAGLHHSDGRDPIDHGSLPGLGDDDHTQYIKHALATAANDFLVASGSGAFIKKTLAEVQALIEASTNLADAISKKHSNSLDHTQGTDQYLDQGGANEVTAANVKDAVNKKHSSGGDTTLGTMTANVNMNSHKLTGLSAPSSNGDSMRATTKITESNLEDAVDKKHTQDTDTKIALTQAPGSDHTATGVIGTFTAGESVTFGQLCYMKSDSKLWKTDANDDAKMPGIAMALASISADATGLFIFFGVVRDDSWAWTVGGMIYASETPGALTQTAPSTAGAFVQPIGIATHADRMLFKPDLAMVKVK